MTRVDLDTLEYGHDRRIADDRHITAIATFGGSASSTITPRPIAANSASPAIARVKSEGGTAAIAGICGCIITRRISITTLTTGHRAIASGTARAAKSGCTITTVPTV